MRPFATAAVCLALALLTFFQFPGHTWLQQDSQIYVPILENLRDPSVLRNDILVQHPHVAFTVYDEAALGLRALTGAGFREVLAAQQIATRAVGIWGLLLMGEALGLAFFPALMVAAICSLGALISGPAVLTLEYEPTPRAFAVPLLICAIGLASLRRYRAAGIAAAVAFLYHPPTALPFWGVYLVFAVWPQRGKAASSGKPADTAGETACPTKDSAPDTVNGGTVGGSDAVGGAAGAVVAQAVWPVRLISSNRRARLDAFIPLVAAIALLWVAARAQSASGDAQRVFARLDSAQEFLQRMRTAYVWVSTWPAATILHHLLILAIAVAAFVRIRHAAGIELRALLLGLAVLGVLTMPLSWLLLEQFHWGLVPQVQPMRVLLFLTLAMQFATAAAGARALAARRLPEAFAWFVVAYWLPIQPLLTGPIAWPRIGLAPALAALTVLAGIRWAPAVAVAAFFVIPIVGGIVNYPQLHTPELTQLSAWARASTPHDAVFVFPDVNRGLAPGIFRSEALRAVYVDWKGGGQVNYLKDLSEQWWFRWRQTRNFQPSDMAQYAATGITYVVLREPLPREPQFQNSAYVVYKLR